MTFSLALSILALVISVGTILYACRRLQRLLAEEEGRAKRLKARASRTEGES